MIKSISYSQEEIINNILKLHVPNHVIDCDCTYSAGNFYKTGKVPEPKLKFDITPQNEEVLYSDSRNLPLDENSIDCMMFDPPFLATTGKSLISSENNNKINKRFGVYSSEKELHQYYYDSLNEIYRVLNDNGILIFKCQDKVSSGKQYMSHCFIYDKAVSIGFYPKDLFVLLAKSRITADWQMKNQKNARKYHSYFWVFQKTKVNVAYVNYPSP